MKGSPAQKGSEEPGHGQEFNATTHLWAAQALEGNRRVTGSQPLLVKLLYPVPFSGGSRL